MMEARCCIEIVLRCESVDFIASFGRWSCSWRAWKVGEWVAPLVLAVRMSIGGVVHPSCRILFIRGVYLLILCWIL